METGAISESKIDVPFDSKYNGSSTSICAAFAGLAAASAAAPAKVVKEVDVDSNNAVIGSGTDAAGDDDTLTPAMRTSLSSIGSLLTRRNYNGPRNVYGAVGSGDSPSQPNLTIQDVKKFVFQVSRTDKRLVAGLRAHAFSSQAFFSSFAVGLAIGSVFAILFRVFYEIGFRVLPFSAK